MNFLFQLLGIGDQPKSQLPDTAFGRFSDAYKSEQQQAYFDESLQLFEEGKHLEAYRTFFEFLYNYKRDNLQLREENDTLYFQFWQGSQRISGIADAQKVSAESRIAKARDLNVGFLRRLMEANFQLKFCRYALDSQNNICIRFDTYTTDGSPQKLLYALRELAIQADKQDDLLLEEFKMLEPFEERQFAPISDQEKQIKYDYLHSQIQQAFALIDKAQPDPNRYPGAYAYMLLALAFKIDYLVRPEGYSMDVLEKAYSAYFEKNNHTPQIKINLVRRELQKLLDRPQEALNNEFYRTISTFGANPAIGHESVVNLINSELPNMDWPLQQKHLELAFAVPQYIAGFALFHYAPPKPVRELLHLFFEVSEAPFFRSLGFANEYQVSTGQLNKTAIQKAVKQVLHRNKSHYPYLKYTPESLNYESMPLFGKTFFQMIRDLDLGRNG
ncbi:MAG: hypothetical protein IT269_08035 [Saprospiraceae bacterium]|nr:hypothetical protein [Saprospiraceae bacterium]